MAEKKKSFRFQSVHFKSDRGFYLLFKHFLFIILTRKNYSYVNSREKKIISIERAVIFKPDRRFFSFFKHFSLFLTGEKLHLCK